MVRLQSLSSLMDHHVLLDLDAMRVSDSVLQSTCTIVFRSGIDDQALARIVEEIRQGTNEIEESNRLAFELGLKYSTTYALFNFLSMQPIPEERLLQALAHIIERHIILCEKVFPLTDTDPQIEHQFELLWSAIENAQYAQADQLLQQAETIKLDAVQQNSEQITAYRLLAAKIYAERGELALAQLDYSRADDYFQSAIGQLPAEHREEQWRFRLRQAETLHEQALLYDAPAELDAAVALYRIVLDDRAMAAATCETSRIQANLGTALLMLGEENSDSKLIQEAVTAFRVAFDGIDRHQHTNLWARIQTRLGNALLALGEEKSSLAHLEAAVASYHLALEISADKQPLLEWAMTQEHLSWALWALEERSASRGYGRSALKALNQAHQILIKELELTPLAAELDHRITNMKKWLRENFSD